MLRIRNDASTETHTKKLQRYKNKNNAFKKTITPALNLKKSF